MKKFNETVMKKKKIDHYRGVAAVKILVEDLSKLELIGNFEFSSKGFFGDQLVYSIFVYAKTEASF